MFNLKDRIFKIRVNSKTFLVPLSLTLLSIFLWISPDYFKSNRFFSVGDGLFPFHLKGRLDHYFFSWQEDSNNALGSAPLPRFGVSLAFYGFLAKLEDLGIPLWVINRLYFILPTLLILFVTYYLAVYRIKSRHKHFAAVAASFFLATSPPQAHLSPTVDLAFAGFILALAGWQRYLDTLKNQHLLPVIVGSFLMFSMPRYLYLMAILAPLQASIWVIFKPARFGKIDISRATKSLTILVVFGFCLNLYTLLPASTFVWEKSTSEFLPTQISFEDRVNKIVNMLTGKSSPLHTLRLTLNVPMPYTEYYSYGILRPLSLALPGVLYLGLYWSLKKKPRSPLHIPPIVFLFLAATLLSIIFGSGLYRSLMQIIPGFWILNNPNYFLSTLSILSTVFLAFIISEALKYADTRNKNNHTIPLTFLIIITFCLAIMTHNGFSIFDRLPKPRNIYSSGEMHIHSLGRRLPYFSIPEEYQNLANLVLSKPNGRTLILPYFRSYIRYRWNRNLPMPEILHTLNSLRSAGWSKFPPEFLQTLKIHIIERQHLKVHSTLKRFDFDFILIHKDLLPVKDSLAAWQDFAAALENEKFFHLLTDNQYFRFYEITSRRPTGVSF